MIIKVNSQNQITMPKSVREKLNIKVGDKLILDIRDGMMILIPQPQSYSNHLQGLHSEIRRGKIPASKMQGTQPPDSRQSHP